MFFCNSLAFSLIQQIFGNPVSTKVQYSFSYSLTYLKRQLLPCLDFSLISPPGTSVFLRRTHLSGSEDKEENPFYSPKGRTSRSGCNSVCFFHVREPVGVIHTQKYVVNIFQVSGVKLDFKNMTRHSWSLPSWSLLSTSTLFWLP